MVCGNQLCMEWKIYLVSLLPFFCFFLYFFFLLFSRSKKSDYVVVDKYIIFHGQSERETFDLLFHRLHWCYSVFSVALIFHSFVPIVISLGRRFHPIRCLLLTLIILPWRVFSFFSIIFLSFLLCKFFFFFCWQPTVFFFTRKIIMNVFSFTSFGSFHFYLTFKQPFLSLLSRVCVYVCV